jgi:hypothetical protein
MNDDVGSTGPPSVLPTIVETLRYKPGWTFKIAGPMGRLLCVFARTPDSHHPERARATQHQFDIPELPDRTSALRWVFDCLLLAELHEAGEFFEVDGFRPFYPHHQDEGSPYELVERSAP